MWEESDVQLVLVEWLKPHEEIKEKARDKLLDMTNRWGGYTKPLLVDMNTGAILDGHHRYSVAKLLNLTKVPALCVDYLNDDSITLDVWQSSEIKQITKQMVIDKSLSDEVFPPKTSKHILSDELPPVFYKLSDLT